MKLGFVSAILEGFTFTEVIDAASLYGYACVEVACWPSGKAERRYAGVSHIDADGLDDEKADEILTYCAMKDVMISSLAYYPNPMDPDPEKQAAAAGHLRKLIKASRRLGVGMVTTFIGRDPRKTVEDNLKRVADTWSPLIELAEKEGVKIAVENCPMLFDRGQWPGGLNLMTTPAIWEKVFHILPSPNLGLNYDPSHFTWQMIDTIKPLYDFADKIFHAHIKDIRIDRDKLNRVGIMGYPLDYMSPKLPGLGGINWGAYVSALIDIGFDGCVCVEVEDRAFEGSAEKRLESLALSKRYMSQFMA